MWTLLREVSLRHLRCSPWRTGLVVVGIALGVAMLCAVMATNEVLIGAFEDMVDRVAGAADLTVAGSEAGIPSSLTGQIADIDGVEHAAAMLEIVTSVPHGEGGSLLVLGVDFLGDPFFLPFAQDGEDSVVEDPLAFVNDPTAILISEKLAESRNLKLGDGLTLITSRGPMTFYVRGLLKAEGPSASYGGQVVVMFIDAAQVSFGRGYSVDRIDIVIEKGAVVDEVKRSIETVVRGRANVEVPQGRVQRMVGALWTFKSGLHMSGLIALCVGMFLIFNAVSVSVAQRRREVGTLRALGVTQRAMIALFSMEALMMATIGIVLGLLLAQRLSTLAVASVEDSINRFVMPIRPAAPRLTPEIVLWGVVAGFGSTLLAAYFPARATNKISPAEAVRSSKSTPFARAVCAGRLAFAGLALSALSAAVSFLGGEANGYLAVALLNLAAALLVPLAIKALRAVFQRPFEVLFGVPGRLAVDNVERVLARSALTVVPLMLAVSMSMSIGGYAQSFEASLLRWTDNSFHSDAVISSGSPLLDRQHVPFDSAIADRLRGIPGVRAFDATRVVQFDYGNRRMEIQAFDSRAGFDQSRRKGHSRTILEGPEHPPRDALYEKPRLWVSENAAHFEKLHVGDTIELDTPTGSHAFEVYAIVVDYSTDQGCLIMDRRWFSEYWGDNLIDAVNIFFDENVDHERVVNAIRARMDGIDGLFVTRYDALREQLRDAAQSLFAYAKAPELITLVIAMMGVVGTMLAAIIDRIREIGMLRAIGATRRQITTSLVTEACFLGLAAALLGVIVGVPLGYTLLKVVGTATSGWSLPYDFPLETSVRTSFFVTATAAFAGLLPARRVARLDVKEALSYE
jgi:putative ABC transport system permease protein